MHQTAKLLQDLIAIPSVNPAFLPEDDRRAGEQRVVEFVAGVGTRLGMDAEWQPVEPGRANVLLRLTPKGNVRQRVLLAPHLDTVGGEPISDRLFVPRHEHGRLYGRGACDTKGCVAAMLTSLGELAQGGSRPTNTEIIFAGLVDEENGQRGSRALVATGLKADFAIVGEPTRLRVVTAHKGNVWLRLQTVGRPAHGSRPELGRNAILFMAHILNVLETEYAIALSRRRHSLLRPPTISVGMIHGGIQPNMVPALCEIVLDRRTLPGETEAGVRREIKALLGRRGLSARMESTKAGLCLPLETDPRLPLVRQFIECTGNKPPCGVDFFCDASVLAHGGIPSVVFGPGDIAQAHTANEWISLHSLESGTRLLARFLRSLP
jgi:acetylornithine deacetylase/succinyl-diaminopimelate desuccinylase-like protein